MSMLGRQNGEQARRSSGTWMHNVRTILEGLGVGIPSVEDVVESGVLSFFDVFGQDKPVGDIMEILNKAGIIDVVTTYEPNVGTARHEGDTLSKTPGEDERPIIEVKTGREVKLDPNAVIVESD